MPLDQLLGPNGLVIGLIAAVGWLAVDHRAADARDRATIAFLTALLKQTADAWDARNEADSRRGT